MAHLVADEALAAEGGPALADVVDRVVHADVGGLPVTSIYAAHGMEKGAERAFQSRVTSVLHQVRPHAEDRSAGHEARLSVRSDIQRIEAAARSAGPHPGTIAFFSCSGARLFEQVALPRQVRDRAIVDATPWVRPMLAVLDEYHRCCVAVIDRRSARIWELYVDTMRELGELGELGGPVAGREEVELERRHFRGVAERLAKLLDGGGYELLAIGGHADEVARFVEYLPKRARPLVAGTFSVDAAAGAPAEVRAAAEQIVEGYERDEERRWVADVLAKHAAGGLAAVGLDDCLWAGSASAVEDLLVEEGAVAPGVVCDSCGLLARSGDVCSVCGNALREVEDVIDELVEKLIDAGSRIEHVQAETELRRHVTAASLRFPLPPP